MNFTEKELLTIVKNLTGKDMTVEELKVRYEEPRTIEELADYPFKAHFRFLAPDRPSVVQELVDWQLDEGMRGSVLTFDEIMDFLDDDISEEAQMATEQWLVNLKFGSMVLDW